MSGRSAQRHEVALLALPQSTPAALVGLYEVTLR
jgi:hypothetical protein